MELSIPLIYDLVTVGFLLVMILLGWHRGLLSGLVRLVGRVASLVVALLLCTPLAQGVYTNFLEEPVVQYVDEQIIDHFGVDVVADNLEELLDQFGDGEAIVTTIVEMMNTLPSQLLPDVQEETDAAQQVVETLSDGSATLWESIAQVAVQPVVVTILQAVIFLLLFLVCTFVVGTLERILQKVNHLPVLGGFNGLGGGLLGAAEGVVWIFVGGMLASLVIAAAGESSWLSNEILRETRLLSKILFFQL